MSGMWLGVDLRKDIKKTCVDKRLDYLLKICSIMNMIGGDLYDHLMSREMSFC